MILDVSHPHHLWRNGRLRDEFASGANVILQSHGVLFWQWLKLIRGLALVLGHIDAFPFLDCLPLQFVGKLSLRESSMLRCCDTAFV